MLKRILLAFLTLLTLALSDPARAQGTTPSEQIAFRAAVRAFEDGRFERAEAQFGRFIERFPSSERNPEAIAFQLRSRAHKLAVEENHSEAAATFRQLRLDFPNSPNHLEFVVGEAWNEYHAGRTDIVVELLAPPTSPFQLSAKIRPNDPLALPLSTSGQLLLAQTLLDIGDFQAAGKALEDVTNWDLRSEFVWRRSLIRTRLLLATDQLTEALENAEALLELATNSENREQIAESAAVLGETRIANDQREAAIMAYEINKHPETSRKRRREAWFKIIELNLEQRDHETVIGILQEFIASGDGDDSLDIVLLTQGDLLLQQFYEEVRKPESPEGTDGKKPNDLLNDALAALERIPQEFADSPLLGEAQYHRGWCYWELGETEESVAAFQAAVERLPASFETAVALFKLADGYYVQGQHQEALRYYQQIIEDYGEISRIRDSFLDQVLYQTVRTAVAADQMDAAATAVNQLLTLYPDNLLAKTSKLIRADHMIHIDKVSEARGVLYEMVEHFTDFPLRPEVEYAIAYTYELQGQWPAAAARYVAWLENYPERPDRARAAYALAWCHSQNNQPTEALALFRNFLRDHGDDQRAQRARLWIGNYHFNRGAFEAAERQYATIYNAGDDAQKSLRQHAGLMAGRAAFRQNRLPQTLRYLEELSDAVRDDATVEPNFKAQIELSLGDAYFEQDRSAPPAKDEPVSKAQIAYSRVSALHPESRLAAVAWGRFGDYSYFVKDYPEAIQAYERVLDEPGADVTIRSQAEVALGAVYERQAETAPPLEARTLHNRALTHYLNVVYQDNLEAEELPDPYWLEEAGFKASHLVEANQDTRAGVKLYRRLAEMIPILRHDWERFRIAHEARAQP